MAAQTSNVCPNLAQFQQPMRLLVIAAIAGLRSPGKGANKNLPDRAAHNLPLGRPRPVCPPPFGVPW
jgi:hypothetical protein